MIRLVSIPNGMEFYSKRSDRRPLGTSRFNSQRDGILRGWAISDGTLLKTRFNSQRDGILPRWYRNLRRMWGCFNSQRDGILPYISSSEVYGIDSFNSQRDGILRFKRRFHSFGYEFVSIPNGMEFYSLSLDACNSLQFQFPTGWNSTFLLFLYKLSVFYVSIPNGMEFYCI